MLPLRVHDIVLLLVSSIVDVDIIEIAFRIISGDHTIRAFALLIESSLNFLQKLS